MTCKQTTPLPGERLHLYGPLNSLREEKATCLWTCHPPGNLVVFITCGFTRTVFPSLAHAWTQQTREYLKTKWNLNGVNNRYFYNTLWFFSFLGDERATAFPELWIWPNSSFYPNEYWNAKLLCPSNKCKRRQKQRGKKIALTICTKSESHNHMYK